MNTPVASGSPSVDLVAAYGFDEGAGALVFDQSGHANSGRIANARVGAASRAGRYVATAEHRSRKIAYDAVESNY